MLLESSVYVIANTTTIGNNPTPLTPIKIIYSSIAKEFIFGSLRYINVLGANPTLHVIERFIKRIWNPFEVNKVGTIVCYAYKSRKV